MQQKMKFAHKFNNMRAELNKINYADQKVRIRISESLCFVSCAVVFMPASFLRLFSFDWYHLPMLHRIRLDVAYLEASNPAFADAFIGGIILQFFLCGLGSFLRVYFSAKSKEIFFVDGEYKVYIADLISVIIFAACCSFVVLNISAFGLSGSHSWFENNPGGNIRGMPMPQNNAVFILTGLCMPVVFFPITLFALMAIESVSGRRIPLAQLLQRDR